MPLYISDYLTDTGHLGTIEHGGYFLLMMHYWIHGPLPDDDTRLRTIARMTPQQWAASRDVLRAFFKLEDDGLLHHKRIDAEIAEAEVIIEAKVEAGRAGGAAARGKSGRKPNSKRMALPFSGAPNLIADEWQKNTQSPSPPTAEGAVGPRARESFDDFWKAYPTVEIMSRAQAEAEWTKLNDEDRTAAIAAVPGFKAFCAKDKTYRPVHPCRFLAERRFEGFAGQSFDPVKAAETTDRADRLMRRGKYADDVAE